MKQYFAWFGWIILLLVACVQLFQQNSQAQKSEKWTYKLTIINSSSLPTKELNELGLEGWEVVTVQGFGYENGQSLVILKRKL